MAQRTMKRGGGRTRMFRSYTRRHPSLAQKSNQAHKTLVRLHQIRKMPNGITKHAKTALKSVHAAQSAASAAVSSAQAAYTAAMMHQQDSRIMASAKAAYRAAQRAQTAATSASIATLGNQDIMNTGLRRSARRSVQNTKDRKVAANVASAASRAARLAVTASKEATKVARGTENANIAGLLNGLSMWKPNKRSK